MSEQAHVFVEASKTKLRFYGAGQLSVEDLWDLPLTKLDEMAVDLDNSLAGSRKSFLTNPDRKAAVEQQQNTLRLEVLKLVIETKQAENAAKREAAAKRARKEFLQRILEKKKIDQLESLSTAEIEKELADLED